MKALLVHNYYQSSSPSGEDAVFEAEKKLLGRRSKGSEDKVKIITYERYNDEINRFSFLKTSLLPFKTMWSRETCQDLRHLIKKEKPDIAHFHNIFYLISPSAYYVCKEMNIPVVQTLHNFRMYCVNGLLMRDGRVCEECVGNLPWRGMVHGCYRNSRLYSLPVALMQGLHRVAGTWSDCVDAYIALTEFGKDKYMECGLPEEKIFVKPNFMQNQPEPDYSSDGYAVFLGRLSGEKGVNTLVDACGVLQKGIHDHFMLKAIGEGPLKKMLELTCRDENFHNIEFTGRKSFSESMDSLKGARFIVMPSICYESFPMAITEAFACGKPVIASRLGAMAELIKDGKTGLLFEAGNAEDLASKIKWLIDNEDACVEMGKNARSVFEEKYTAEKNYEILMKIYRSVLAKY